MHLDDSVDRLLTCDDGVLTCVDSVDIATGKSCVFSEPD